MLTFPSFSVYCCSNLIYIQLLDITDVDFLWVLVLFELFMFITPFTGADPENFSRGGPALGLSKIYNCGSAQI